MTSIADRVIDWRSQFSALDPYLKGQGGVVHVRLGSDSPGSAFAKALRLSMTKGEWPSAWSSVQIDREDPSTHYVSDIVQQIRRTVGLAAETSPQTAPIRIDIGREIKAGGDVNISGIEVSASSYPAPDSLPEMNSEGLRDALREELGKRRIALLFMNTHEYSRQELVRIRRVLWDGVLDSLLDHGLLVFDFSDPMKISDSTIWPPDPCLAIELLDRYDESARADALDDLAQAVFEDGVIPTLEQARGFAEAILQTSQNIRDMYARLAMCIIAPRQADNGN